MKASLTLFALCLFLPTLSAGQTTYNGVASFYHFEDNFTSEERYGTVKLVEFFSDSTKISILDTVGFQVIFLELLSGKLSLGFNNGRVKVLKYDSDSIVFEFRNEYSYEIVDHSVPIGDPNRYRTVHGGYIGIARISTTNAGIKRQDLSFSPLNIYPHPAHRFLNLHMSDNERSVVTVCDNLGRIVLVSILEGEYGVLDISSLLPSGYTLKVQSKDGLTIEQFIKY